jgi:hypothetical protein
LFLDQIPRPFDQADLKVDDAKRPLAVIQTAFTDVPDEPVGTARIARRRDVGKRIFELVSQLTRDAFYIQ